MPKEKVSPEIQAVADKIHSQLIKAIKTKWNEQHSMTPEQIKEQAIKSATLHLIKYFPDADIKENPNDPDSLLVTFSATFSAKYINLTGTIIDEC